MFPSLNVKVFWNGSICDPTMELNYLPSEQPWHMIITSLSSCFGKWSFFMHFNASNHIGRNDVWGLFPVNNELHSNSFLTHTWTHRHRTTHIAHCAVNWVSYCFQVVSKVFVFLLSLAWALFSCPIQTKYIFSKIYYEDIKKTRPMEWRPRSFLCRNPSGWAA